MKLKFLKTLQEICIDAIAENFDFLIDIYNSENGNTPRKHFEFLQRTYSKAILDKICENCVLQDNSVRFLINPYLKKLDVKSNCFQSPHVIIEQLKIVGSNITSINMREKYFAEEIIMELVSLVPNVKELYLSQTKSTDKVLLNIGKYCPQLHTLDIRFCHITKGGLISLCIKDENGEIKPNYLLKKLYISDCSVDEDGVIFALTHFPSLEVLGHDYVGKVIYQTYLSKFLDGTLNDAIKYNFTKLDLFNLDFQVMFPETNFGRCIMADVLQACSVLCPHVVSLKVNDIANQDVLASCNFTYLKSIKLRSSHLVDYSRLFRSNGHSLVKIELISGVVSVDVLSKFCPKLKNLILHSVKFEKLTESSMNSAKTASFPNMSSLTLQGMEFVDNVAETIVFLLNCSPVLKYLFLPCCRFLSKNQFFITSVIKCDCMKTLRELDFSYSDIEVSSVQQFLLVTQNLEQLVIEDCDISRTGYEEILNVLKAENRAVEVVWSPNYGMNFDYVCVYDGGDYEFFDASDRF